MEQIKKEVEEFKAETYKPVKWIIFAGVIVSVVATVVIPTAKLIASAFKPSKDPAVTE